MNNLIVFAKSRNVCWRCKRPRDGDEPWYHMKTRIYFCRKCFNNTDHGEIIRILDGDRGAQ